MMERNSPSLGAELLLAPEPGARRGTPHRGPGNVVQLHVLLILDHMRTVFNSCGQQKGLEHWVAVCWSRGTLRYVAIGSYEYTAASKMEGFLASSGGWHGTVPLDVLDSCTTPAGQQKAVNSEDSSQKVVPVGFGDHWGAVRLSWQQTEPMQTVPAYLASMAGTYDLG